MVKRPLPGLPQLSTDTARLLDVLNEEKDLAVIIVAASFLDACLGSILENRLKKGNTSGRLLESGKGALGTFAIRADLCYVLELIPKDIYQDLMLLAEIRNVCAHNHLATDFTTPEVARLISDLSFVESFLRNAGGDALQLLDTVKDADRK